MRRIVFCVLLLSSTAVADTARTLEDIVELAISGASRDPANFNAPRFAFHGGGFSDVAKSIDDALPGVGDIGNAKKTTVGVSADGTAAWIASDVAEYAICGDSRNCYKKPDSWSHVTALFEIKGPKSVAWHVATPMTGKEQAAALAKGGKLGALPKKVDAGAEDVAKQFEATLADPKALAATVSARKDVVLYGSELKERYVGGGKAKAQFLKWNLAFKIRDGIQAGVTASKSVAWVAAHVDATPIKKPTAKPTPYRVLFFYEREKDVWKLVNAHFSFVP